VYLTDKITSSLKAVKVKEILSLHLTGKQIELNFNIVINDYFS